jgi:plastocyanin
MIKFDLKLAKPALALAVAAIFAIAGCGKSKSPTSSNNNPPPSTSHFHAVDIQNFLYSPASLTIASGDTVKWTNHDSAPHTVTSDTGNELQSPQLGQGATFQHVFGAGGTFAYHCTIHSSMHGSVTVQ